MEQEGVHEVFANLCILQGGFKVMLQGSYEGEAILELFVEFNRQHVIWFHVTLSEVIQDNVAGKIMVVENCVFLH